MSNSINHVNEYNLLNANLDAIKDKRDGHENITFFLIPIWIHESFSKNLRKQSNDGTIPNKPRNLVGYNIFMGDKRWTCSRKVLEVSLTQMKRAHTRYLVGPCFEQN
jgi:hypothetical protein